MQGRQTKFTDLKTRREKAGKYKKTKEIGKRREKREIK